VTDGNLSRHLTVLEEPSPVSIPKDYERKWPRTWVKATKRGRAVFAEYLPTNTV
jgi:hypothetical protein